MKKKKNNSNNHLTNLIIMKRKQESEHIRKYFVTYKELSDSILSTGDMKMEKKITKKGVAFVLTLQMVGKNLINKGKPKRK